MLRILGVKRAKRTGKIPPPNAVLVSMKKTLFIALLITALLVLAAGGWAAQRLKLAPA
jgi:hypothetical protein